MAGMVLDTGGITVRVRSSVGMWRFNGVDPMEPVGALQQRIETEKNVPVHQQKLSSDPKGLDLMDPSIPLAKYVEQSNSQ